MRAKTLKSVVCILLSILCMYMFSGGLMLGSWVEGKINDPNKEFTVVGDTTVTCTYNEELKGYDVLVEGIAKNNGDRTWEWLTITVMLYDQEGNALGSAMDSIEYISAQGTWRFRATGIASYEVASANLYEFSGYTNQFLG